MAVIYLVGFMGSGKTSVGAALAAMLGVHFIDLDQALCERLGASVAEVFAGHGEAVFRQQETLLLTETTRLDQGVVASGGGTFCSEFNRRLIEDAGGISVYLEASWATLLARLPGKQADRPKFGDPEHASELFLAREPLYRMALLTVTVEPHHSPHEVARRVVQALERLTDPPHQPSMGERVLHE